MTVLQYLRTIPYICIALLASGLFIVSAQVAPERPGNDDFLNAFRIEQEPGPILVSGTTAGATREPSEPFNNYGVRSVWYKWTPARSGYVSVVLNGGVSVWIFKAAGEARVTDLTVVARDFEKPWIEGNVTYFVGAFGSGGGGNFEMQLSVNATRPINDDLENAIELKEQNGKVEVSGTTFGATFERSEPGPTNGVGSVWYRWRPGKTGPVHIAAEGSSKPRIWFVIRSFGSDLRDFNTAWRPGDRPYLLKGWDYYIAVYNDSEREGPFRFSMEIVELSNQPPPVNDNITNALELYESNGRVTVTGTGVGATLEPNEYDEFNGTPSVWYKWVPSSGASSIETQMGTAYYRFYTAPSVSNAQSIPRDQLQAGRTYYLKAVTSTPFEFIIRLSNNDTFANAIDLRGTSVFFGAPQGAGSREPGEPAPACFPSGGTFWYRYVPASDATIKWLCGYQNKPGGLLATYSGNSLDNLTLLACGVAGDLDVHAGTVYYMQLLAGTPLCTLFTIAHQSNDDLDGALPVAPMTYNYESLYLENAGLGFQPDEPLAWRDAKGRSQWFRWDATESGILTVSSHYTGDLSLNEHARMAAYTGKGLSDLKRVPAVEGEPDYESFYGEAGQRYYIQLDSANRQWNDPRIYFHLERAMDATNDAFSNAQPFIGNVPESPHYFVDAATREPGEPIHADENEKSLWFRYQTAADAGARARFSLLSNGSIRDGTIAVYRGSELTNLSLVAKGQSELSWPTLPGEVFHIALAVPVEQNGTVAFAIEGSQSVETLDFKPIGDIPVYSGPIRLEASASDGLPVFFRVVSGPAQIYDDLLSATGSGEVVVHASTRWAMAQQRFTINVGPGGIPYVKSPQHIDFNLAEIPVGEAVALRAVNTSGEITQFALVSGPAIVKSNEIKAYDEGEIIVRGWVLGNDFYQPVAVERVVRATARPVIHFDEISSVGFGAAPVKLKAVSSNGLPVTFELVSGPAIISGDTLTATGPGEVTVRAKQDQSTGAVPPLPVERTFKILRGVQSIAFRPIPGNVTSTDLHATASSGLPVTFRLVDGNASLNGTVLQPLGPGTIRIEASQAGDALYLPATPRIETVIVGERAAQRIEFSNVDPIVFGSGPITLEAKANSGLPVSYLIASGPGLIEGNRFSSTAAGIAAVIARQEGNEFFLPAPDVVQYIGIERAPQVIVFDPIDVSASSILLKAASSAGLPVRFKIVSGEGRIDDNVLVNNGPGPLTIEASQDGNPDYAPATPAYQTVLGSGVPQIIEFDQLTDIELEPLSRQSERRLTSLSLAAFGFQQDPGAIYLSARTSSTLPVRFAVRSGPAQVAGNVLSVNGVGQIEVVALQDGDNVFAPASASQSFTAKLRILSLPIEFDPLPPLFFGDGLVPMNAVAISGLPVRLEVISGPAQIEGTFLLITGVGTGMLRATEIRSDNVEPSSVERGFIVHKGRQTISFPAVTGAVFGLPAIEMQASATSGLPVQLEVISGRATIEANLLKPLEAGEITVRASQRGGALYNPAAPVEQIIQVARRPQVLILEPLVGLKYGDSPQPLRASSTSGGTVEFRVVSGNASINGGFLSLHGAGTVIIEVTQNGDANHLPVSVLQTVEVAKMAQTIEFDFHQKVFLRDGPVALSATASSGLPVTYSIALGEGAIKDALLFGSGSGPIVITASQGGNQNFLPADPVNRTIRFLEPPNLVWSKSASMLSVEWLPDYSNFVLERASRIDGPWTTVPTPAASGLHHEGIPDTGATFFRLKQVPPE